MALDPSARVGMEVASLDGNAMMRPVRNGWQAQGAHYEYRVLTLGETANRNDTRRLLTDEAEYGRWELARTMLFPCGTTGQSVLRTWMILRRSQTLRRPPGKSMVRASSQRCLLYTSDAADE